jgi:uncharacterized membrane protein (UPF0136 family)
MVDKVLIIAYIVILCVGGFFGWKAGSTISLVMSSISAVLVAIGMALMNSQTKVGYALIGFVGAVLTVTFIIRFIQTHKPMPAIPMLVVSIPILLLSLYRLMK